MTNRTEQLMGVFEEAYKELSKWDMRKATFNNPMAGLIFLVFLKHISDNKDALALDYPEKFDFDFLVLLYGEKVSREELINHIADTEKKLGFTNGILESFAGEIGLLNLHRRQLTPLFEAINSLNLKVANDSTYEVYDALVSYISLQSRREIRFAGDYLSDVNLSKLMAAMADVKNHMSVYDFACGYGITAAEAVRGTHAEVYAQDMNKVAAATSIMLLTIAMRSKATVRCEDTITNPLSFEQDRGNKKFDRILSVPPLGFKAVRNNGTIESGQQADAFQYGLTYKLTGDIVFARHLLATLKDDGIGILLMPVGSLFRGGNEGKIREEMLADNYIDAVIELPNGIVPGTSVKTALVIFKKNRISQDIYILDLSKDGAKDYVERVGRVGTTISEKGLEAIRDLVASRQEVEGLAQLVSRFEIMKNSSNLCAGAYIRQDFESLIELKDTDKIINQNNTLMDRLQHLEKSFLEVVRRL